MRLLTRLSGTGIAINQGTIIMLGVVLWLVTLVISILFVMRYAKKVKANKGSTILSLQEQEVMKEEFGEAQQEAVEAEANPNEKLMTARQKWSLIVFALTFVVMIVRLYPVGRFRRRYLQLRVRLPRKLPMQVSGDDISAAWTDNEVGGELSFTGDVEGTVTTEEQISEGWSVVPDGRSAGAVVLRRGIDLVPAHGSGHRRVSAGCV